MRGFTVYIAHIAAVGERYEPRMGNKNETRNETKLVKGRHTLATVQVGEVTSSILQCIMAKPFTVQAPFE
jgi:hypothetical protein